MAKRFWKGRTPNSLPQALEWCKDYAKDKRNLSVEQIADRMTLADRWVLYKWIKNGRMPAVLIPAYETACGADFASCWLASNRGRLVIQMPTGKRSSAREIMVLQGEVSSAVTALLDFYETKAELKKTLCKIQCAMEGLGYHYRNVEQHKTPELPLFGD